MKYRRYGESEGWRFLPQQHRSDFFGACRHVGHAWPQLIDIRCVFCIHRGLGLTRTAFNALTSDSLFNVGVSVVPLTPVLNQNPFPFFCHACF